MDIVSALHADEGVTCFVGAGGKKTTMYHLAERVARAIVTNTVRIPLFDPSVEEVVLAEDPATVPREVEARPLGIVRAQEGDDRYQGYEPEMIDRLAASTADPILVKADGARMRRFKAPGQGEPQLPTSTTTVVPIASVHVVGEPLDDRLVHRVDRVAELTGLSPGDTITTDDVATVLASTQGGMKAVPANARVVPLLNMVDTSALAETAEAIATAIHAKTTVERVVLAEMRASSPLVDIV